MAEEEQEKEPSLKQEIVDALKEWCLASTSHGESKSHSALNISCS